MKDKSYGRLEQLGHKPFTVSRFHLVSGVQICVHEVYEGSFDL